MILSCTTNNQVDYGHNIHFFKHAMPNMSYAMGVTLSAGHSLNWLKEKLLKAYSFDEILNFAEKSTIGANGLLFSPYIQGERTPHGDAYIRGSFIGINSNTEEADFARATVEGITYSLYESIVYMRETVGILMKLFRLVVALEVVFGYKCKQIFSILKSLH